MRSILLNTNIAKEDPLTEPIVAQHNKVYIKRYFSWKWKDNRQRSIIYWTAWILNPYSSGYPVHKLFACSLPQTIFLLVRYQTSYSKPHNIYPSNLKLCSDKFLRMKKNLRRKRNNVQYYSIEKIKHAPLCGARQILVLGVKFIPETRISDLPERHNKQSSTLYFFE